MTKGGSKKSFTPSSVTMYNILLHKTYLEKSLPSSWMWARNFQKNLIWGTCKNATILNVLCQILTQSEIFFFLGPPLVSLFVTSFEKVFFFFFLFSGDREGGREGGRRTRHTQEGNKSSNFELDLRKKKKGFSFLARSLDQWTFGERRKNKNPDRP